MSSFETIFWLLLSVLGLIFSGLFSGLETGVYSLSRVRLHVLSHQGDRRAERLRKMLVEPGTLVAALLIGTNVATNLATSSLGVILDDMDLEEWQVIIAVMLIATPTLFVFAETLPKDLFAFHADRLVYPFVTLMVRLKQLFTALGLLPLVTFVSRVLLKSLAPEAPAEALHPRRTVTALVKEGLGLGLLSDEQSALVERVMALADRTVADQMTPWSQVVTVAEQASPQTLWDLAERMPHSRLPVIDADGAVVGILAVNDVLWHEPDSCPPIRQLMTTAPMLSAQTSLRVALRHVQTAGPLAIIGSKAVPQGIVTVKALVEPITGELANW